MDEFYDYLANLITECVREKPGCTFDYLVERVWHKAIARGIMQAVDDGMIRTVAGQNYFVN